MARGTAALCVAALALACTASCAAAMRDTLDLTRWTLEQRVFGAPHTRAEYELPDGVKRDTPAADKYFRRWLQCSTLTTWCTVDEVLCGCTYEPTGTWYRGRFAWCACC